MTDKKTEALKLALEALEECRQDPRLKYEHPYYDKTIAAIREALVEQPAQQRPQNCGTGYCSCIECPYEQPAQQQEPVGKWMGDCIEWTENPYKLRKGQPIYTSPQPASKSVTDEQLYEDAFEQGVHEGSSKAMRECRDAYFQSMNVNLRKLNEAPQRKPLTDEQKKELFKEWADARGVWPRLTHEEIFYAGIEAAHGIKEKNA